jgi:hypothetical protein
MRKQNDGNLKETVLALEKRIWEAYKAQDRAAFQSLLADDFEGVNMQGKPFDKAGELKYVSNCCVTEYELKHVKVILLTQSSALVTYEVHYKVRPTGAQKITARRNRVLQIGLSRLARQSGRARSQYR